MINYLRTFHSAILALILLISLCGCGYKDDPYYPKDENLVSNENF